MNLKQPKSSRKWSTRMYLSGIWTPVASEQRQWAYDKHFYLFLYRSFKNRLCIHMLREFKKRLNITATATVCMGLEHQFLFNNIHEVQQLGPQPTKNLNPRTRQDLHCAEFCWHKFCLCRLLLASEDNTKKRKLKLEYLREN